MMARKMRWLVTFVLAALAVLAVGPGPAAAVTLAVADAADITNLDPHRSVNAPSISVVNHLAEALVINGRDGIKPSLATRYEVSPDGLVYTFHLRKGVKFHDGTAFDAEAVKVNFDRVITPAMKGTIGNNYLGMLKETVVVDPHTVKVVLGKPFGAFLNHIGHPSVGHIVSPAFVKKMGWDAVSARLIGTGPYKFVQWDRGDRLVMERFDDYWGAKGAFDRIVYRPVGEASTRVAMVESGEAQLALNLPVEDVERLRKNPKLEIVRSTSVITSHIWINTRRKPFDDVRVRRALNHAVDREQIVNAIFGGAAIPVSTPVAPQVFAHKPVGAYAYDLAKAKALLAEAGVQPGLKVRLESDRRQPKITEVITTVAAMLRQVGLDVSTNISGDYAMYLQTRSKRDYDLSYFAWGPFSLDPDAVFFPLYHSSVVGKHFNFADYANPEVDKLIEAARASSNPAERKAMYEKLQQMVFADAPAIYLYWPVTLNAATKGLEGLWIDPRIMWWIHDARMR